MTEPTTEKTPEEKWQALAQARAEAEIELLKSYAMLGEKAKNNNLIADDINEVDGIYNKKMTIINNEDDKISKELQSQKSLKIEEKISEVSKFIKEKLDPSWNDDTSKTHTQRMEDINKFRSAIVDDTSNDHDFDKFAKKANVTMYLGILGIELSEMINSDYEMKREDNYLIPSKEIIDYWKQINPEKMRIIKNTQGMDNSFQNIYISGAPTKNLTLPDCTDTSEKLLSALLHNNAGVAIGDNHSQEAAKKFIIDNIKVLKRSGVDTIYLEMSENYFSDLNKLSITELRDKINNITPEESQKNAQLNAESHDTKNGHDSHTAFLKLFLSAKENGIDIVNIDKTGDAREFAFNRASSTNYTWTENILKDRINKLQDGKYIVFGGKGHFTQSHKANGLVDEALGLPVISFDNRNINISNQVLRGTSTSGEDFYLPAGECHPDNKKTAEIVDKLRLNNIPESIRKLLPEIAIETIRGIALKELDAHYKNEPCVNVSEASTKTPTYVPTTPPPQPASQEHTQK